MGAVAQVDSRIKYERTKDLGRMLTSGPLAKAIIREVKREFAKQEPETNIFRGVLPAKAATNAEYKAGAGEAWFWNGGGPKKKIPFPVKNGYYLLGEGADEFGVPNGEPSNHDNPNALYLVRKQNGDFSGSVGLGSHRGGWVGDGGGRDFDAFDVWFDDSGVALVATPPLIAGHQQLVIALNELMQTGTPEQREAARRLLDTLQ